MNESVGRQGKGPVDTVFILEQTMMIDGVSFLDFCQYSPKFASEVKKLVFRINTPRRKKYRNDFSPVNVQYFNIFNELALVSNINAVLDTFLDQRSAPAIVRNSCFIYVSLKVKAFRLIRYASFSFFWDSIDM